MMVMRRDGSAPRALTHAPGTRRAPAWSPDGRLIGFLSKEDGGVFELYVMRPNGSQKQRVPTRAPGLQPDVTSFAWLPDGRLAYTSRTGPAQEGLTITTVDGMQSSVSWELGAPRPGRPMDAGSHSSSLGSEAHRSTHARRLADHRSA